jgi:ADP-ribose pyrophosphatase
VVYLYLATGLQPIEQRPEEHEVFEVHWMPYVQALQMAQSGELRDGKSAVAIFRAMSRLQTPC